MIDQYFGELSKRQLHLRWFVPWQFERWTDYGPRFAWLNLLNPFRWFRSVLPRENWGFWWRYARESNSRCYCPVGSLFRGRIVLAGWGFCWWYSVFDASTPCPCDEAFDENAGEEESEVRA